MSVRSHTRDAATVASISDLSVARRAVAAMLLLGIALIHVIDVKDKFEEVPYIGVLFLALIATSLILAVLMMRSDDPMIWLAAAGLAGSTIIGYVLSRSTGLPGEGGAEVGNWWESLGLASLFVEGAVVLLAGMRLTERHS